MSPSDLLGIRFLLASAGCLAAGLAVWAVTALCRRLPGFAGQRSLWLLAQCTLVATFLLILLPHSERLRMVPPIELADTVSAPAAPAPAAAHSTSTASAPAASSPALAWYRHAAQAWLALYLLGLGIALARLAAARRDLRCLAAAGSALPDPHRHAGFGDLAGLAPSLTVIEVDAPISPLLFGLFKPCLLLPRHLRQFDPLQQQMIIAHELTHLRRRDLHWMGLAILMETLLWFNPVMRMLRVELAWAQELGCDRDVLQRQCSAARRTYAGALVAQLKLQQRPVSAALAFGAASASSMAARIAQIRAPGSGAPRLVTRLAAGAGLGAIVLGSLALQPALARRKAPLHAQTGPISCTAMADAASGAPLVQDGQCDQRVTPASTFNIAVSLMGYDSGILHDAATPALPFRQGDADWYPAWRQTTTPTSWFDHSVVWYTQRVTQRLGQARFQDYVARFNYGNQDLAGDAGKDNGLTMAWISSSLAISPNEQVAFLRGVVGRSLPLSARAYDMTVRIMPPIALANGWVVHGKTGTAAPVLPDGRDDDSRQYGWYVGWASKGGRTIVFARLVQDAKKETGSAGWRVKQAFLRELPARLDAL